MVIKKKEFHEIITLACDNSELTRIKLTNSVGNSFYFGIDSIGQFFYLDENRQVWVKLIKEKKQNT